MAQITGIQAVCILGRWSMVTGWIEKFRPSSSQRQDFVSYHASRQELSRQSTKKPPLHPFELTGIKSQGPISNVKYIDVTFNSVIPDPEDDEDIPLHRRTRSAATTRTAATATTTTSGRISPDRESSGSERRYHKPRMSFSTPVPPQSMPSRRVPPAAHFRNGLALNPPSDTQVNVQKPLSAIKEISQQGASRDSNRFELDRTSVLFTDTTDSRPGSSRPTSSWLSIETVDEEEEEEEDDSDVSLNEVAR